MTEQDAWRRKIIEKLEAIDTNTLQLIYFFIVGLERRNVRTVKAKK